VIRNVQFVLVNTHGVLDLDLLATDQFPQTCQSTSALCCNVVHEIRETFLWTSVWPFLCIYLCKETCVPPKILIPQLTAPFAQHLHASKELTFHSTASWRKIMVKVIQSHDTHESLAPPKAGVCTGTFEPLPTLVLVGAEWLLNHPVV
jgi:hypothetical protein